MIGQLAPGTRVHLWCAPVDMRKGFDGLSALVADVVKTDPFSGHLFVFRSRRGDYLKVLHWDRSLRLQMEAVLGKISGKTAFAGAIRYSLSRWQAFTRYTTDGRLDICNNAAERVIRPLALGRKNWLFAGSDSGGERAAVM